MPKVNDAGRASIFLTGGPGSKYWPSHTLVVKSILAGLFSGAPI